MAIFTSAEHAIVVVPPFPIEEDGVAETFDPGDLLRLLDTRPTVGVVLIRLGRFAVGVVKGDKLVATKTDTRYVKNRHRAGGSSQRRFMRSRDRLIRELYDETCQVTHRILTPYENDLDYIMMGGERQTVNGFVNRCEYVQRLDATKLSRRLDVEKPNQRALEGIADEMWKSRILTLRRVFPEDEVVG